MDLLVALITVLGSKANGNSWSKSLLFGLIAWLIALLLLWIWASAYVLKNEKKQSND